jgi:hypothetical protein
MAKNSDPLPNFDTENTGGVLSGLLAEEEDFDRRSLWRLGSWGVGTVAAVVVAVLANQSALRSRMDLVASDDLARQAQQLRTVARDSQNETRRLASAVDTLNADRDRLYTRVTVLEQGLDSVTGSIAKQNSAAAKPQAASAPAAPAVSAPAAPAEPQSASQSPAPTPAPAAPAPAVAPVATTAAAATEKPRADAAAADTGPATVASVAQTGSIPAPAATPATSLMPPKSMMAPPDAAATKLIEPEKPASAVTAAPIPEVVASIPPVANAEPDQLAIRRTEFAVDVGSARSISGLRALWLGLLKSNAALAALRPVIAVKETSNGFGMQLRLLAGPLSDAAAAAKICAALVEGQRTCETTVFDGQRLAMQGDEKLNTAVLPSIKPAAVRPFRKRSNPKPVANAAPPPKPDGWTLSSLLNRR